MGPYDDRDDGDPRAGSGRLHAEAVRDPRALPQRRPGAPRGVPARRRRMAGDAVRRRPRAVAGPAGEQGRPADERDVRPAHRHLRRGREARRRLRRRAVAAHAEQRPAPAHPAAIAGQQGVHAAPDGSVPAADQPAGQRHAGRDREPRRRRPGRRVRPAAADRDHLRRARHPVQRPRAVPGMGRPAGRRRSPAGGRRERVEERHRVRPQGDRGEARAPRRRHGQRAGRRAPRAATG